MTDRTPHLAAGRTNRAPSPDRRRAVRARLLPLALALVASGCTGGAMPLSSSQFGLSAASIDGPPRAHALARDLPVHAAGATLPLTVGEAVSVTRTDRPDGTAIQRIALAGDSATRGENWIEVTERMSARPGRITARSIGLELQKAFPTVPMAIDRVLRSNPYGPFGLASGDDGELRCHYAWQRLAGARGRSTDIRVRLCRSDVTRDAMVSAMQDLRVTGARPGSERSGRTLADAPGFSLSAADKAGSPSADDPKG